jgi:hypothetical protein
VTVDVEAVAAAARGCPLVADLTGGRFGEVATYRPGRRSLGVRQADGAVEVHVVARWGTPLPELADVVRATVAPYAGGLPISVFIEDIELPGTASPAELTEASVGSP